MSNRRSPSGHQYTLWHGDQELVVTEVGGGLRTYTVGDRPVLDGYGMHEMATGARGHTLIPWPNRIDGGRYRFAGTDYVLALTEPEAGNAIHGLTRWANWDLAEQSEDHLILRYTLHAQTGWPFVLDCELGYRLGASGLTVRTSATNVGSQACPYATGAHPYLTVDTDRIDDAVIQVESEFYYPTNERGIPTGRAGVGGTHYDIREPILLASRQIDVAYTGLRRDPDGRAWVRMSRPGGPEVALWLSEAYNYVEIFTGDTLPAPQRRRGLGVEPMTAAPNAFRTGDGLLALQPGERHDAEWGIEI
jgi:aldose 1-epimerase